MLNDKLVHEGTTASPWAIEKAAIVASDIAPSKIFPAARDWWKLATIAGFGCNRRNVAKVLVYGGYPYAGGLLGISNKSVWKLTMD